VESVSRTSPPDPDEQDHATDAFERSVSEASPEPTTSVPAGRSHAVATRASWIARTIVIPVLIGLGGAWIGMMVAGRQTIVLGPFDVQLAANVGRGDTVIRLPPFGTLTADTHRAPLHVTATLQDVDIEKLTTTVSEQGVSALVDATQQKALKAIGPFALRLFIVAMLGAVAAALVVFRGKWRPVAIAGLAAFLLVGGSELTAYATFRPAAFTQPQFSGSLVLAHQLLGPVERATGRLQDFTDELSRVIGGAAQVYGSIGELPGSTSGEIRVLHISDIHLSPLGMDFARELAKAFDVDFVVDTGDITSFGTPAENLILTSIPSFGIPYVFVRGNHDSLGLQAAIARVKNVRVLDGTSITIDGLEIYGRGDPAFTPNRLAALDDQEVAALVRSAGPQVDADVAALPRVPDIVAVHDDRMTQGLAGEVPLVISGHFHVTHAYVVRGTQYLQVGSTGGAGANVFTEVGGIPLQAQILSFVPGSPPRLIAYDDIQQSPETGSLTVTRHLVTEGEGHLVLTPQPPTPSGTFGVPSPSGSFGTPSP
jgi:predicted phosphodiesterase